ncbi:J domain-containing protein [Hyphomicrobium facile]|uniref:DnaJ domain-containing protein n=1 Tax=Hyphomicrobium facile TaxID=51670 RepID=A0A1I7NIX3_9HYPH|nr:J domain-containing protein [Hyphomicrobium facile]SFV34607.1 hypothetical protein SAMN04488557_2378 [Hyphomicrobium facile]
MSASQAKALKAALDLIRMPSQVRVMRSAPLPPGVLLLLRLAASELEAEREAGKINNRAPDANREAAIFFIEQVLLASNSDSYRVLGLDDTATLAELRRHMAYLLKWLHPDLSRDPHKARLAQRVLIAWNELKAGKRAREGQKDSSPPHLMRAPNSSCRQRAFGATRQRGDRQTQLRTITGGFGSLFRRRIWPL